MNKIKSYSDFCNEEINIKKTLAGLALGTSLAFGNPSVGNTQISKNIENTQSNKSEEVKEFSKYRYSLKTDQKFAFNFYKKISDVSDDLIYKDFLKGERYNQTKITKGISEIINSHKLIPASAWKKDVDGGEPALFGHNDHKLKQVFIVDDFDFKKDEIDEFKSSMDLSNKDWNNLIKSKTINTKMPFIVWDTKKYKSKKYADLSGWMNGEENSMRNTFYFINKNDLKEIKKELNEIYKAKIISKFDLYKLITKLTDYGIIKDYEITSTIKRIKSKELDGEIVDGIIKDAENQIDALLEYGIITKDKFFDNTNDYDINLLENTEVSKNDTLKIVDFSNNNKVIKLEKKDGSIVYFNGGMNSFLEYFDQKFDDKYISDFIKKHIKNSFPNQNIGKITVISKIGKVKIIGTDDLKFENIEKEILNINFKDTTKLNNFIDENSKVLLQKEDGEKISITIKRFKSDDLGTGPLRFGKDLQDLINGKIKIGMNQDMIEFALDHPADIDRQTGTKYEEIYIYKGRDFRKSGDGYYLGYSKYDNTYLSFEDGILKSIMDR